MFFENSSMSVSFVIIQINRCFKVERWYFFHLVHTVEASGDVNISEGTIGAVAGPGAHVETVSVGNQLQPPSKDRGTWFTLTLPTHVQTCSFTKWISF